MKRVAVAPQQNTHQTHSHPLRFACSSFNTEHSVPHDTNSNPSLSMASSSSFSSLCSFPPLTPASTFTKPPKLPYLTAPPTLSPQLPKRCRFATSVTKDREVAVVKDNQLEEKRSRFDDADPDRLLSRAINTALVLGFGTFAVSKLLTIDHDYWHGWTLYEILRYVPEHNWVAYEQALKSNPVLAKMAISGVVYSIGDWIAQCYEGKPLFEFDRTRLFRSGLAGFTLHGSLSHYYYQLCESLFPFQEWWVVPAKVAFDQTVWAAIWNSIYFVVLGLLRFESINNIYGELKSTFWPMLTAGWKLWPFAHLITYGVIPLEQRLLWVDCVELIWVTILSTYSNEKSEARISDGASSETKSSTLSHKSNKASWKQGDKIFRFITVTTNKSNQHCEKLLI
ncbi:uncharacterized protein LOC107462181 isoform X1 [Arachis duranensis]|uniref:Peroxisomal membrane protein n=2 Tax=Arachis TaxID=3817 RepID=A0A445BX88_ARAHY|nr:uncharacterized protein LOC107462181 isoform X1 [Arachis duranensis]XP_025614446.1 uncharacterized protein LOC112707094 isoform X1 [Arachis hypogaea]RYR43333.1 hypothetical protein Ahy_A08g039754 [Arachis hypogaea]